MSKNRTILLSLLIPLLLDLLVFFASAPARRGRCGATAFEERGAEVVESLVEFEEECEEEEEFGHLCVAFMRDDAVHAPRVLSRRQFFSPPRRPASQPFGWSMPLLI